VPIRSQLDLRRRMAPDMHVPCGRVISPAHLTELACHQLIVRVTVVVRVTVPDVPLKVSVRPAFANARLTDTMLPDCKKLRRFVANTSSRNRILDFSAD